MPTVVGFYFRRFGGLLQIGVKTNFGHGTLLSTFMLLAAAQLPGYLLPLDFLRLAASMRALHGNHQLVALLLGN
jgi:hypothetical protein